ncbi:MAG: hypothetical protein IPJ41_18125 [Phycisphaerales bacterium]|nr:hypothetical protein [Phycisphaerales bacterium]
MGQRDRVLEVGDDVGSVFDTYAHADEPVGDAHLEPVLAGHIGVRHGDGVGQERLDAAQVLDERAEPALLSTLTAASAPPTTSKLRSPPQAAEVLPARPARAAGSRRGR